MEGIEIYFVEDGMERRVFVDHSVTLLIRKSGEPPWAGLELSLVDERPDYELDPTLLIFDRDAGEEPVFKYRPLEA